MVHTVVYPICAVSSPQSIRHGLEDNVDTFFFPSHHCLWDLSLLCHSWNRVSIVSYKSNACPVLSFLDGVQLYLLFDRNSVFGLCCAISRGRVTVEYGHSGMSES